MRRYWSLLAVLGLALFLASLPPSLAGAIYEARSAFATLPNPVAISKALIVTVQTQDYFLAIWRVCIFGLGALCFAVLISQAGEVRLALRRAGELGGVRR
jgi:hypothetical protein